MTNSSCSPLCFSGSFLRMSCSEGEIHVSDFVSHICPSFFELLIAYKKWACCQTWSHVCIYPYESLEKGKALSMFKGHAIMARLPQRLSNGLCHSPGPVRVKGNTAWKYDAGDIFITGSALAQPNPISLHGTYQNCQDPFSATQVCCCVTTQERAANYCLENVWQSLSIRRVVSVRLQPSIPSQHVPLFPSVCSSILLRMWPIREVTHSPCQCFGWLQLSRLLTNCLRKKTTSCEPAVPPASILPPDQPPSISDVLLLVSTRRQTTISPIVLH